MESIPRQDQRGARDVQTAAAQGGMDGAPDGLWCLAQPVAHACRLAGQRAPMRTVAGAEPCLEAGYWIDELDNWSFLEYWVNAKENERHATSRAFV